MVNQHEWINMSQLTILRSYAEKEDPEKAIPPSILFAHTDKTLTIFDRYPKSTFHFLILPRLSAYTGEGKGKLKVEDLADLRSLLKKGRSRARKVIQDLKEAADECRKEIEAEMVDMYKFKWDVWVGFHPVPSMQYVSRITIRKLQA